MTLSSAVYEVTGPALPSKGYVCLAHRCALFDADHDWSLRFQLLNAAGRKARMCGICFQLWKGSKP